MAVLRGRPPCCGLPRTGMELVARSGPQLWPFPRWPSPRRLRHGGADWPSSSPSRPAPPRW
eukprot:2945136-Alexandrium_andersonii.AAC.1